MRYSQNNQALKFAYCITQNSMINQKLVLQLETNDFAVVALGIIYWFPG